MINFDVKLVDELGKIQGIMVDTPLKRVFFYYDIFPTTHQNFLELRPEQAETLAAALLAAAKVARGNEARNENN